MTDPASSARFYAALPAFSEFDRFVEFETYAPLPEDWVLVCGDIRGSTRAIAEGRYKQVNMVGAAVITTVLNACAGTDIPFVFGGDGGMVAVPGALRDPAAEALRRLQRHAEATFGLGLRAAAVPVARLRDEGLDVRVRKYALGPSNNLAMFAGGGAERADAILKTASADDPALLAPSDDDLPPDLAGLSCRWEPLTAARGQMIALMVQPRQGTAEATVLRDTLAALSRILGGDVAGFAPVSDRTLRFRWPPRGLALEARAAAAQAGFAAAYVRALASSALQKWAEWRRGRAGPYDAARYRTEMKSQTDFRKFDGLLRTVLDVSPEQADRIESWLEAEFRAGRLVYGLHRDRQALMTCLVFSLDRGDHVHFVDAAGGGFARAAEGLKARLAGLSAPRAER